MSPSIAPPHLRNIVAVLETDTDNFVQLAKLGGLDPISSFQRADLRHVDFGSGDFSGYNFFGANVSGANFLNARSLKPSMFKEATFDQTTIWPEYLHDIMASCSNVDSPFSGSYRNLNLQWEEWSDNLYWKYHNIDYDLALEYCKHIRKVCPENRKARYFEAHMLEAHFGRALDAIKLLRGYISQDPDEINYYFFLAQALRTAGRIAEAENEYNNALSSASGINRARILCDLVNLIIEDSDADVKYKIGDLELMLKEAEKLGNGDVAVASKIARARAGILSSLENYEGGRSPEESRSAKTWWRRALSFLTGRLTLRR